MKRYKDIPYIILAFYGLLAYAIGTMLSMTSFLGYIVKLLSVGFILWTLIKAPKRNKKGKLSTIISLFVGYTVFILLRGTIIGRVPVDMGHQVTSIYDIVQFFLWSQYSSLSFIVILFILVPFDPKEIGCYRVFAYICTALCLIGVIRYGDNLFNATTFGQTDLTINGRELSIRNLITASFIGLGAVYLHAYNYNLFRKSILDYFPLVVLVIFFVSTVAGGGRGGSATAFIYCIGALFFYIQGAKDKRRHSPFRIITIVAVIVAAVYGLRYMYITGYFDFLFLRLFEGGEIGGELNESSREFYLSNLVDYLNSHPLAWVFGRGANGYYTVSNGTLRSTIETGWWYMILKGGIIYLVLYVYLLLKAAYLGFFKSNNQFVKSLGVLCLIRAYTLIPFGLPDVSLEFVMIMHFVRLINSDSLRNMSDAEIKMLINERTRSRTYSRL